MDLEAKNNPLLAKYGDIKTIHNLVNAELAQQPQADCPVEHIFAPGLYIRKLSVAAGTLAIGHIQKTEHLNIFLKGTVKILKEDGTTTTLTAPMIFTSPPGRKCGFVLEDMIWLNVYATAETDVAILEETYIDKSESIMPPMIPLDRSADRQDYELVLQEFGFTPEQVKEQVENLDDQIPFPFGGYKVQRAPSDIAGEGLFATANIKRGEIICPSRIGEKRTPAGRYVNHSANPNCVMVEQFGDVYLVALTDISGCRGGLVGDELTTNYRDNIKLVRRLSLCHPWP